MELLHGLYNNSKSTATGIYIFKFSSLPSEIYCWNTLIKRNTVLCHHHFMETVIKKSFLRLKLLPGSFSSQTLPGKITTPKQKELIAVKSTPKRTQKTSLFNYFAFIFTLPLLNNEEPLAEDVVTQTDNTLFELLDHDYSLYHTDYILY